MNKEIVIVDGCRSPIGDFGGLFKDFLPSDLTLPVVEKLLERANVEKELVDEIILGNCIQRTDDVNVARTVVVKAGFPNETTGVTVHRQCSSAMQAIITGYHELSAGDVNMVIAGGVEAMSSSPYLLKKARWGHRLQHVEVNDSVWEVLTDPVVKLLMGETAENLAKKYNISRQEQDEIAFRSHTNAVKAMQDGLFDEEIVPINVPRGKKGFFLADKDEHLRENISLEQLASLKPVFRKDGTVTAGNSSGINDGAAAVLMTTAQRANQLGLKVMGRIVSYAWAGVEPQLMGYGPVPAIKKALKKSGLTLNDIQLIELNEAFAAQYLACEKLLGLDREITNVNGSGIALGHPIGCTGARIIVTLLHEMARRNLCYGLAALCVGGGMGMAIVVER
jgi:acetyl-CoA C-acetyltransferase